MLRARDPAEGGVTWPTSMNLFLWFIGFCTQCQSCKYYEDVAYIVQEGSSISTRIGRDVLRDALCGEGLREIEIRKDLGNDDHFENYMWVKCITGILTSLEGLKREDVKEVHGELQG